MAERSNLVPKNIAEIMQVRKNILMCLNMIGYETGPYENISSAELLALNENVDFLTMDIFKTREGPRPSEHVLSDTFLASPSSASSSASSSSDESSSSAFSSSSSSSSSYSSSSSSSSFRVPESENIQEMILNPSLATELPLTEKPPMVRVVFIDSKLSKDILIRQIETHFQESLYINSTSLHSAEEIAGNPSSEVMKRNNEASQTHADQKLRNQDTLMIITLKQSAIRDQINEYLRRYWETKKIFITAQSYKYFMFCILKHQYVPPHIILSEDEKSNVMKRYRVREEQELSEISRFDPVAIAILLRPGQMVEIQRPSLTAGIAYHYRICVQK